MYITNNIDAYVCTNLLFPVERFVIIKGNALYLCPLFGVFGDREGDPMDNRRCVGVVGVRGGVFARITGLDDFVGVLGKSSEPSFWGSAESIDVSVAVCVSFKIRSSKFSRAIEKSCILSSVTSSLSESVSEQSSGNTAAVVSLSKTSGDNASVEIILHVFWSRYYK